MKKTTSILFVFVLFFNMNYLKAEKNTIRSKKITNKQVSTTLKTMQTGKIIVRNIIRK